MSTLHEQARAGCEHCPDGHAQPESRPWGVFVASEVDGDGQPTHLYVAPTAGQHVAESDAEWVRARLNEAATRTRVVTTVTELDALPVGGVVRTKHLSYIKYAAKSWIGARGTRVDSMTLSAFAPLTVLYEPEEGR